MSNKPRRIDLSADNFIAGIAGQMSAEQLGLYWLICLLIYSNGGPVDYNEHRFAALLPGTHWRSIRSASQRLQELGKITVCDGQVMAKGCAEPLQAAFMRVSKAVENGAKGGRPHKENNDLEKPDGFQKEKLTRVTPPSPPQSPPSSLRSDEARPPKADRSKPRTLLPENFPEDGDLKWARDRWISKGRADLCDQMDDEVQKFRDHHTAKSTRSADWSASWRTWVGNAMNFSKVSRNGNGNNDLFTSRTSAAVSAAARTIDRLREAEGVQSRDG